MEDPSETSRNFGETGAIELTGRIMVVAVIFLFFVVVILFCIHLFAKWYWYHRYGTTTTATTRRRRRFDFAGHHEITVVRRGLEPSALKALPVVAFDPQVFKDGLECAVCLSEVCEGEKTRLLPKCNHGFHVDCIDMWFQSHSTCPLCRNPVANHDQSSSGSETAMEATGENEGSNSNVITLETANFPTNVLIWGDDTRVSTLAPSVVEENHQNNSANAEPSSSSSSSSSSSVVIDIPRQVSEEEEQKSPVPTRLRTLKRLLSGNRRVNPSSPRNLDLEQGNSRVQS